MPLKSKNSEIDFHENFDRLVLRTEKRSRADIFYKQHTNSERCLCQVSVLDLVAVSRTTLLKKVKNLSKPLLFLNRNLEQKIIVLKQATRCNAESRPDTSPTTHTTTLKNFHARSFLSSEIEKSQESIKKKERLFCATLYRVAHS